MRVKSKSRNEESGGIKAQRKRILSQIFSDLCRNCPLEQSGERQTVTELFTVSFSHSLVLLFISPFGDSATLGLCLIFSLCQYCAEQNHGAYDRCSPVLWILLVDKTTDVKWLQIKCVIEEFFTLHIECDSDHLKDNIHVKKMIFLQETWKGVC